MAGKWASCAIGHYLMSDGAEADNRLVVFAIIETKQSGKALAITLTASTLLCVRCYLIACTEKSSHLYSTLTASNLYYKCDPICQNLT